MSEYTPITSELRAAMRPWGWVESDGSITFTSSSAPPSIDAEKALAISGTDFTKLCDAIDSIHAQLERENAALKAELDRVLGEQEDRRSCIYYDAERHYCSCHDIDTDGLVELPKDVDGVPIRVGDVLAEGKADSQKADSLMLDYDGWSVNFGLGWCVVKYHKWHHVKPDTWERIIEDAWSGKDSGKNLVARCKALCERTKGEA